MLTKLARIAAAVGLTLASSLANSQAQYPSRPIRMVVPFSAGGITDVLVRLVGDRLSQRLGQPVVIDNRPGANGVIGAAAVAKADPDGYTILPIGGSSFTSTFFKELPFDFHRDFAPITLFWVGGYVLLVNGDVPAKTLQEFVAYGKANPGKLNWGSAGAPGIMMAELFMKTAGIQAVNIQFKSNAQTVQSLAAGDVQFVFDAPNSNMPHLQAGKVRALAFTLKERLPLLPTVPTFAEAGYPNLNGTFNGGAWAPAATPRPIIDRLNKEIHAVLAQPDVKEKVLSLGGAVAQPTSPEGLREFIRNDQAFWAEAARISGLKPQ